MKSKKIFFCRTAALAGLVAAVLQCSGSSQLAVAQPGVPVVAPANATSVAARVQASVGATLSIGRSLSLTVPAGALNQDTNISVTQVGAAAPSENLVPIGSALSMGADGTEFNTNVALNVCYDPALGDYRLATEHCERPNCRCDIVLQNSRRAVFHSGAVDSRLS